MALAFLSARALSSCSSAPSLGLESTSASRTGSPAAELSSPLALALGLVSELVLTVALVAIASGIATGVLRWHRDFHMRCHCHWCSRSCCHCYCHWLWHWHRRDNHKCHRFAAPAVTRQLARGQRFPAGLCSGLTWGVVRAGVPQRRGAGAHPRGAADAGAWRCSRGAVVKL